MSNNDGCAIARSEEAKAVGIEMGAPEYLIRDLINTNNVAVFSSNYTLYGDMSERVMKLLASFVPRLELYSIDEAFLDMHDLPYTNLLELGMNIRNTVQHFTGIPVTVGIAPTKTLAKLANRFAKKKRRDVGVHWLANDELIEEALKATAVGDVWGIGPQYAKMLKAKGFNTAYDVSKAPDDFILEQMTVVGHRLLNELKGTPSIEWEFERPRKKNICTSRSFGTLVETKELMIEALTNYVSINAGKLRKDKSCAKSVHVFVQTNPYRTQDTQYSATITVQLPVASNTTNELIKYAKYGLDVIFKPGFKYLKCGVITMDIVPEEQIQYGMFDQVNRGRNKTVMNALDKVNRAFGKDTVRFAVQGYEKRYKLKAAYLSKRYTTNFDEILTIKI